MTNSEHKFGIAIKRIKKTYPYGELIPESDRPWCYLATDNGPCGSGDLIFSEYGNYRKYFASIDSAVEYWEKYKNVIRENWECFDTKTISIREFTTKHEKMLSF